MCRTAIIFALGNLLILGPAADSSTDISRNDNSFLLTIFDGGVFVDKTLFIKDIAEDQHKIIVITRPPNWGKTMNLDMLMMFFDMEYTMCGALIPESIRFHSKLFIGGQVRIPRYFYGGRTITVKPLKIAQYEHLMESQGKHPVLKMTMRRPGKVRPYDDNEFTLIDQLRNAFGNIRYLQKFARENNATWEKFSKYLYYNSRRADVELSREELVDCLKFAIEVMHKRRNQTVYVLVDDFELPFIFLNEDLQQEDVDKTMELFAEVYGRALGNNPMVEKAVFTGVMLPEDVRCKVFSRVNASMTVSTLFDEKFSQFYGFREHEVEELFEKPEVSDDNQVELNASCGGYNYNGLVYHPSVTVDRLFSGLQSYFHRKEIIFDFVGLDISLQDELFDGLESYMSNDLQRLYLGEAIIYPMVPITCDNIRSPFVIPSLLVSFGCLNPAAKGDGNDVLINAPNYRTKGWLGVRIEKWVQKQLRMGDVFPELKEFLIRREFEKFRRMWMNHTTVKEMDVLLGNGIMISLWDDTRSHSIPQLRCVRWVKSNDTGMISPILCPVGNEYPFNNTAMIVEYRISYDEWFQDEATRCVSQTDIYVYRQVLGSCEGIDKIVKMCLVFREQDVTVGWGEEKVEWEVEHDNDEITTINETINQ